LPKFFIFLDKYNNRILQNNNIKIGVIYRNYQALNREIELIKIAKFCKRKRYQLFVSNDIRLAIKYKADGVYIPSFNKVKVFKNLEKKRIKVIGSAHNQQEIHKKKIQNCHAIFLSPIFKTEKNKKFLGIQKFNYITLRNNIKILGLGGINTDNIRQLKLFKIKGFGGKSIFKKKTGLLKAGFHKD